MAGGSHGRWDQPEHQGALLRALALWDEVWGLGTSMWGTGLRAARPRLPRAPCGPLLSFSFQSNLQASPPSEPSPQKKGLEGGGVLAGSGAWSPVLATPRDSAGAQPDGAVRRPSHLRDSHPFCCWGAELKERLFTRPVTPDPQPGSNPAPLSQPAPAEMLPRPCQRPPSGPPLPHPQTLALQSGLATRLPAVLWMGFLFCPGRDMGVAPARLAHREGGEWKPRGQTFH